MLFRVTWYPYAFFKLHHLYLSQQCIFQPMVIPPVPPATIFTPSDRISCWKSASLLRGFWLQLLFDCRKKILPLNDGDNPFFRPIEELTVDSSFSSPTLLVIIATNFDIHTRSAEMEAMIAANKIRAVVFHAEITPSFGFRMQYSTLIFFVSHTVFL